MRLRGRTGRTIGVILVVGLAGCGGSGNGSPTSPTGGGNNGGGGNTGPACRTYFTNENITTKTSGTSFVFKAIQTSNFDTATRQATTQVKFANGSVCSTGVASYNSVADFVGEVRVVPPVFLALGTSAKTSGQCGTGAGGTLTYHYDSSRRLTGWTQTPGTSTTFSAWDSAGRPTAGTTSTGGTITYVYDDGARTSKQTQKPENAVSTNTYDANGNLLKTVLVTGGTTVTTTFDIASTATVCK